jgi:prepilin-type processing-associated H-X9-DG protein
MSGIGKAMLIYFNDYDKYPTPEKWCDLLVEKCELQENVFQCQGAKDGPCNYALNKNVASLGSITDPNIVLLFETSPGWNQVGGPEILTTKNHKGEGCNVLFLDGHLEFIKTEDISKLKWKP